MAKGGYFLGIDGGTTGTTVLVLDENWQVVGKGYRRHQMNIPRSGWMEQDPEVLWEDLLFAAKAALEELGLSRSQLEGRILGLGLDHQGETCLVWDRKTGKPLSMAINWQDRRTAQAADRLAANSNFLIRERTGLHADAYFSATKWKWILENDPQLAKRAQNGEICAGTLDSWFVYKMTGGRVHITDPSTASRTMLYNIHTGDWDDDLLALLDLPRAMLPAIRTSAQLYGCTEPDCFLGLRVPVSGVVVDQQAALFGQGCFKNGMVKTTYGTGCFMLMNTGQRPVLSTGGLLTTVGWNLGNGDVFALDGGVYTAGSAVNWLRDKAKLIESASDTQKMACAVKDNGGVYFVPAFVGLAAPHWDPYARGTMVGISADTTREHMVRATLESIAYQVRDNLDAMRTDSGLEIPIMRVDGGMVANPFLMQFQADVLGIPVDVPIISETSALGAAYLAALGVGYFGKTSEIEGNWQLERRYEPAMGEDQRQTLLYNWHRAVERSLAWQEH
ncbi:MAG: glycerol kinase GlpK [Pygmaiobacter massiliensis]|nr:glycerol kinase GlpK [Pygmaiobacter massiliensis]